MSRRALQKLQRRSRYKKRPNLYFVLNQKKDSKIDPHVSNLKSREFLFRRVQVHPEIKKNITAAAMVIPFAIRGMAFANGQGIVACLPLPLNSEFPFPFPFPQNSFWGGGVQSLESRFSRQKTNKRNGWSIDSDSRSDLN